MAPRGVTIVTNTPRIGEKIKISGGGKCNITNRLMGPSYYDGDQTFIEHVLTCFDNHALLAWLEKGGLIPVARKGGHYFCPEGSWELLDLLKRTISPKTKIYYDTSVQHLEKSGDFFTLTTSRGTMYARRVVIASGGLSYPSIGATGIGFEIARTLGHTVETVGPALVGWTLQKEQFWMKELSGISLPVVLEVGGRKFCDQLLFAHKGLTGPSVLNGSLYWTKGSVQIDFLAGESLKKFWHDPKKNISTLLPLPKRLTLAFLASLGIKDQPLEKLTEVDKERLTLLSRYTMAPAGTFGYTKAEATRGGVATHEIDPLTMESRLVEGVYFVGEVIDVTGQVGGYNFQWAASSAFVASQVL